MPDCVSVLYEAFWAKIAEDRAIKRGNLTDHIVARRIAALRRLSELDNIEQGHSCVLCSPRSDVSRETRSKP